MKTVSLTVDGREVTVSAGASVLAAAHAADIYVPTLCHDDDLEPYGACRLCIVQIEGARGLPTACTTVAVDGMVGQFSVLAPRTVTQNVPSQQDTGLGTWGIIAIVAVVVVLIVALIVIFKQ